MRRRSKNSLSLSTVWIFTAAATYRRCGGVVLALLESLWDSRLCCRSRRFQGSLSVTPRGLAARARANRNALRWPGGQAHFWRADEPHVFVTAFSLGEKLLRSKSKDTNRFPYVVFELV